MKQTLMLLCALFSSTNSQEAFEFTLFFSDSENNKDSITLGYGAGATKYLDEQFDEADISEEPIKAGLDVRIFVPDTSHQSISKFELKKSVTPIGNCSDSSIYNILAIFTKNWPVTVSWNRSSFDDECSGASVITSNPTDVASSLNLDEIQLKDTSTFILDHVGPPSLGYVRGSDTAYFIYHGFSTHVFDRGRTSIKYLDFRRKFPARMERSFRKTYGGRLINGVKIK